jgi:hypothetical protein
MEEMMDSTTLVTMAVLAVFVVLYLARRKARVTHEDMD